MKEIKQNKLISEIKKLKEYRLVDITAVDEGNKISLIYHFDNKKITSFKINLPGKKPCIDSIINVFPNADIFEREAHDLFGVEFIGNPNLHEKLLLAEDWKEKKPPLKK